MARLPDGMLAKRYVIARCTNGQSRKYAMFVNGYCSHDNPQHFTWWKDHATRMIKALAESWAIELNRQAKGEAVYKVSSIR